MARTKDAPRNDFKEYGFDKYYFRGRDGQTYQGIEALRRADEAWKEANLTFMCPVCFGHFPSKKLSAHAAFCRAQVNPSKRYKEF